MFSQYLKTILIIAALLSYVFSCSPSPQSSTQSQSLKKPEDVVKTYIEAIKNNDIDILIKIRSNYYTDELMKIRKQSLPEQVANKKINEVINENRKSWSEFFNKLKAEKTVFFRHGDLDSLLTLPNYNYKITKVDYIVRHNFEGGSIYIVWVELNYPDINTAPVYSEGPPFSSPDDRKPKKIKQLFAGIGVKEVEGITAANSNDLIIVSGELEITSYY
jgi:hypothetical protein